MHRSKSPEVRESDQLLIEVEKFKAAVAKPTGRDRSYDFDLTELKNWLIQNDDDNFFHLTCHIEPILKERIEQGQFVDLEKLLPKNRYQTMTEEQKMQLVTKNGATYWVPVTSDQKIGGVQRWEQAFRIYAAIYSKANPQRSAEIWQYIHVKNSAAASYAWENVAYYDFTFRQLMAEKPHQSWAKTYTQLWNLAMCTPLNPQVKSQGGGQQSGSSTTRADWRDRCCWQYNWGNKCKKWNCNYDHHCNYCGSYNHGRYNCPRRKHEGWEDYNTGHKPNHDHDCDLSPQSPWKRKHQKSKN